MKYQGLDPECGIWMYVRKLRDDEDNNKVLVRWDGYNVETWLNECEMRNAIIKRPLKPRPKKGDWPTVKHPSKLQRFDGIKVVRADGTTSERKIVYINDPYNGNVITTCKETIRYELLSEWTETSSEKSTGLPNKEFDTTSGTTESDTPSPRSPSPPPPWTPEEPVITSTPNKRRKGDKTSIPRKTNTDQSSKRKNTSTVAVNKKAAKVLSTGVPNQVLSAGPQLTSASSSCSIPSSMLQKSKDLLQKKKDEAVKKGSTRGNDGQPLHMPNQTMPTTVDERSVTVTATNVVEEASIGALKTEIRQLRTMVQSLQESIRNVEADVAKLNNDVSVLQTSQESVSLGHTSAIIAESMDLINEEPSFDESSFSTPLPDINDTPLYSTGFIASSPPLASTSAFTVNSPPSTSAIPLPADENTREPSGACELSHTFLHSLSCYADRPSVVARKLVSVVFTRRETETCNCNGSHGREALPPEKMASLKKYLFAITQTPASRQAAVWKSVTTSLDASFRSQRAYKKKKQMKIGQGIDNQ